jgi:elongation factor G
LGASVKNRGVQPLLDGIVSYLPSPTEKKPIKCFENPKLLRRPIKQESFCGYIFKIIHDKEKGPLSYVRVYSGILNKTIGIKNSTKETIEKSTLSII